MKKQVIVNPDQKKSISDALFDIAKRFSNYIENSCPACIERDIAIERLTECVLWLQATLNKKD